jgi:uncharacterized protein DUF4412
MMRRARLPLLILATLVAPRLGAQRTFDGVVAYKMDTDGRPVETVFMTRGSKVRQETTVPGAAGSPSVVLYDYASGAVTMLMPAQRQYATSSFRDMLRVAQRGQAPPPSTTVTVRATGRHETIAGMRCEVYAVGDGRGEGGDACVVTDQGHFMAMEGPAGTGGGDPRFAAFFRQFKDGALPLRITFGGKTVFLATRVERKALPDELFRAPPGYTPMGH